MNAVALTQQAELRVEALRRLCGATLGRKHGRGRSHPADPPLLGWASAVQRWLAVGHPLRMQLAHTDVDDIAQGRPGGWPSMTPARPTARNSQPSPV